MERGSAPRGQEQDNSADVAERSVLVVEDHQKQLDALLTELASIGVSPAVAKSGVEAIRMAATQRPDIILLDGLLPNMHGFEVARFIRHSDRDYRPFIVMTTAIYKGVRYENEARLRFGVDRYVEKPITREKLLSIFKHAARERYKGAA
ncbi:MAG: response regulator [Acidobacteria bacterium]|nr:response regulator [Acidobacteriota bacterium]